MTDKPHNNFFITVFSNQDNMVDLITQLLPEVNAKIDIESLEIDNTSYIDEKLKDLYSDIVYNCNSKKGKKTKIALLFEHKSYPVAYPRFQLADYIFSILRNNVKNNEALTLVIPILFYHGETPWKYRTLTSYYGEIEDDLKVYVPDFKYHLIDLTQYTDEQILSLKVSFLINSLIAFKHKNDSNYIKEQPERVFHRLELYTNSPDSYRDYTQMFFRSLTIYIMASTKITGKEMGQIIETLPKKGQETLKSTYENVIDMGIVIGEKKGISIGKKRGAEIKSIELTFDAVQSDLKIPFIANFLKVPEKVVRLIKAAVKDKIQSKEFQTLLAIELIRAFKNLDAEDISKFSKLSIKEVENLTKLLSDDKI